MDMNGFDQASDNMMSPQQLLADANGQTDLKPWSPGPENMFRGGNETVLAGIGSAALSSLSRLHGFAILKVAESKLKAGASKAGKARTKIITQTVSLISKLNIRKSKPATTRPSPGELFSKWR
jgi:hypothetical protein